MQKNSHAISSCPPWTMLIHYSDATGASWHLKRPTTQLFAQQLGPDWHHSCIQLALCDRGIPRWLVDSPHKGPVMWITFLCNDVILIVMVTQLRVGEVCRDATLAGCRPAPHTYSPSSAQEESCHLHWAETLCQAYQWRFPGSTRRCRCGPRQTWWTHPETVADTGLILGLRPANERRHYLVTASLIGWAQT